ncbi:hypothetical protein Agub_g12930, partial [Astrephomene gubernaculifera]
RDELAAAARRRLPASVYGRIVAAMGWEAHLVDLLMWVGDPRVASAVASRVVRLCPDLAPGMAATLVAVLREKGDAVLSNCWPPVVQRPLACWLPTSHVSRLAESPAVISSFAEAVQRAAAAAASAVRNEGDRWMPCLLLLARVLIAAIRQPYGSSSAGSGSQSPARMACEALQEGLCAWQDVLVADVVASSSGCSSADGSSSGGAPGFVRLLQGQLLPLLDELGRQHIAAQLQQQPQQQPQQQETSKQQRSQLLPSYASVIQLRSRIALLSLAVGAATATATAAAAAKGSQMHGLPPDTAESVHRTDPGGSAQVPRVASGTDLLTPDGVWSNLAPAGHSGSGGANSAGGPTSSVLLTGSGSSGGDSAAPPARPVWLLAATVGDSRTKTFSFRTSGIASVLALPAIKKLEGSAAFGQWQQQQQHKPNTTSRPASTRGLREALAAAAVALLTPGLASWLAVQRDPRVGAVAGADPYSPFRMALALLEFLQVAMTGSDEAVREVVVTAGEGAVAAREGAVGAGEGAAAALTEMAVEGSQLQLTVLRMSAECIACVGAAEQQAALQEVIVAGPAFRSLRSLLAADADLCAAAGRALIAVSNRTTAVEGSLDRLALSAQQEAQRLAAAARELLPYAVLAPYACVRRLILDGLTHAGQQPWVLQLLRCFATVATAPVAAAASASRGGSSARVGSTSSASVVLACLQEVLREASRLLRTSGDVRSLLGLVDGLVEAGVVAPRQLLAELAIGALETREGAGAAASAEVRCALLLVRRLLSGGASAAPRLSYSTAAATELAAARPAALLLAAARTLTSLYDSYESRRQLDAAAVDAAAEVLELGVELYGNHLLTSTAAGAAAAASASERRGQLAELAAGCNRLPMRIAAMLLPLLELPATIQTGAGLPEENTGDRTANADAEDDDDDGGGAMRALTSKFLPAAKWRPRSLRSADPRVARDVVYDTLAFAASSDAHASLVRRAFLDAAVDADAAAGSDESDQSANDHSVVGIADCDAVWAAWGSEVDPPPAAVSAAADARYGSNNATARHLAATAARGLPQLPPAMLLQALIASLAVLLPTATAKQVRRLLLSVLPAVVRLGGGAAALLPGLREAVVASRRTQPGSRPDKGGGRMEAAEEADLLGMITEVLGAELPRDGPAGRQQSAADVAVACGISCCAAIEALNAAALARTEAEATTPSAVSSGGGGTAGTRQEDDDGAVAAAAAAVVADRCAAHLALLVTRLGALAAEVAASGSVRRQEEQQQQLQLRHQLEGAGEGGAGRVTVVAAVLLSGLCEAAATAAAAGAGFDVWQAIILSVLQHLVSALAAVSSSSSSPLAAAAAATASDAAPASNASVGAGADTWTCGMLRSVRRTLRVLPGTAPEVLWRAVERLCEEEEEEKEEGRESGMMNADAGRAVSSGSLAAALAALEAEEGC